MENGQKSAEWEAQVFNRSRTREEYVKLVATLIWKLRDYNKKVYFIFDLGHIMKTQIKEFLWPDGKITGPVRTVQWSLGIVYFHIGQAQSGIQGQI